MKTQPTSKTGSALLLTLLVVSLLLVVVLSFTVYVRLELRAVANQQNLIQARQNAKLGMHLALAQLQKTAGPDQRVTARAEILGDTVTDGNRFLTGVWDTTLPTAAPGSLPRWLVSDAFHSPDPENNSFDELLIGSETLGKSPIDAEGQKLYVYAGAVPISSGTYSWVVGDLGVKANVGTVDRHDEINTPGYRNTNANFTTRDSWRKERAWKMAPSINDISNIIQDSFPHVLFTHDREDPVDPNNRIKTAALLERATSFKDTALFSDIGVKKVDTIDQDFYHSFTTQSRFTLSNTLDGGLRQDLTHLRRMPEPTQLELDAAFSAPVWEYITPATWEFVNFDKLTYFSNYNSILPNSSQGFTLIPDVSLDYGAGPVGFTTAPLPTEVFWNAGLGIRSTTSGPTKDIYLYFYGVVEMLNPFSSKLNLGNGGGANPENPSDLQIRISNFPQIEIINDTKGISQKVDLSDLVVAFNSNSFNEHDPGYMRSNFSPTSGYKTNISGNMGKGVVAVKIGEFTSTPETRDNFKVRFETSDLKLEIGESNHNARTDAERDKWGFFLSNSSMASGIPRFNTNEDPSATPIPLQVFTLQNWGDFEINYLGSDDLERFVHGGTSMNRNRLSKDKVNFGVHIKVVDDWIDAVAANSPQPLDDFLSYSNFRQFNVIIDMNSPTDGDGQNFDISAPLDTSRSAVNNTVDVFHGANFGSDLANRRARLFDFPTQEPISVGVFNQLTFFGFPYQPLGNLPDTRLPPTLQGTGNGVSESLHNFFDRYFFSTLPENASDWNGYSPLPNQLIRPADLSELNASTLASADSSRALLIEGGLNINSISPTAWQAVLQSFKNSTLTFTDTDRKRVKKHVKGYIFYNHLFSGDLEISSNNPQFNFRDHTEQLFLKNSFKSKPSHEAMIQGLRDISGEELTKLADNVTKEIKIFTEANKRPFFSITEFLNTGIFQKAIDDVPQLNDGPSGRIPTLSAAYFGVGTLLNHIAPKLFARSDTFVIRSSGSISNLSGTSTESKAYLETVVQRMPNENMGTFGRKYEIISSKWINVVP